MIMLWNNIRDNNDSKIISTLKFLLNHFTRKWNNKSQILKKKKNYSSFSQNRKNWQGEIEFIKNTVTTSLKKQLTFRERSSMMTNIKNNFVKDKPSLLNTVRKHIPKEIEFTLNDSSK